MKGAMKLKKLMMKKSMRTKYFWMKELKTLSGKKLI